MKKYTERGRMESERGNDRRENKNVFSDNHKKDKDDYFTKYICELERVCRSMRRTQSFSVYFLNYHNMSACFSVLQVCRGFGQRLEISISVLQEWWR